MSIIRLTEEFTFEMAHSLWNYNGSCRNVHGHSYKLYVTVIGNVSGEFNNPKNGMVMDFSDLSNLVKSLIVNELDHSFVISSDADVNSLRKINQMFEKMKVVDFQPTCENLLVYISEIIKNNLPGHIRLFSLKLYETPVSSAEWYAGDQE